MHLKQSKIHSIVKHTTLNLKLRMKIFIITGVTNFKVLLIYLFSLNDASEIDRP